jgi:hypothetical protein
MLRVCRSTVALGLVTLGFLLGFAVAVRAQGVPASMLVSSRDTAVIKSQLRLAITLGSDVLARLEGAPTDDSVPIDPVLLRKASDTYALIRAGRSGFELEKEWNDGKKGILPDPIKDLAFRRVDNAWNLSRTPLDFRNSPGMPRAEYLQLSADNLRRAIQLLNQALAILP